MVRATVLRRTVAIVGVAALLVGASLRASAAEPAAAMKPVIVATLAGYDELYRDIDFLGRASGNPDLARSVEGLVNLLTQLQGLVGLDKARPLGAAVRSDGVQFQIFAFLPVKNIKQLFSALSGIVGVPQKVGEHQWRINVRGGSAFVRERDGWAFVAQLEDNLNDLPDDPAALLEDLPKHYDLAVRVHVQAIPEPLRDMLLDQLKQKLPEQGSAAEGKRHRLSLRDLGVDGEAIAQLDQLTLGYDLDPTGRRTYLDVSFTGLPGSTLAQTAAASPPPPSKMTGFLLADAPLSVHVNRRLPPHAIDRDAALVHALEQTLVQRIEHMPALKTPEERAEITGWVQQVAAALIATFETGHTNAGLLVRDGCVALGCEIEQAAALEKIFRQASQRALAGGHPPQVRLDVEKLGDVRFHSLTMPTNELIPKDLGSDESDELADAAREALGKETQLTMGFGPGRVYLAIGPGGLATLKRAIEQSNSQPTGDAALLRVRLALGEFLQWWLTDSANPIWAQIADELAASGKDHLLLTVSPIGRGFRVRLEGEEGVVKALGVRLKMMAVGPGAF